MSLNDIDLYYPKCISALHTFDYLSNEPSSLQMYLEEAIKNKSGNTKDLTKLVTPALKQYKTEELKSNQVNVYEETKTTSSSDNDLDDLMDLMCIICNEMDVGARNRLLECSDCHALYHQECHRPPVTQLELDGLWVCQNCKDLKKIPASPTPMSPSRDVSPLTSASSSSSKHSSLKSASGTPVQTSTSPLLFKSENSKSPQGYELHLYEPDERQVSSWSKVSSKTPPSGRSPSSVSPSSSSGVKNTMTPNINIISADKRIQIMKKKAAKLQEKRKLPR